MTDGNTLIVDVIQKGDDYILNDTPVNMMIAYEVVRRHVTDSGTFYSQMTKKQKTAEGYSFVFDTGDTFTCTSDTAYPTAESVSDETGGGSGGVLVVTDTEGTLDKTWQEIHDAMLSGGAVVSFSETDTGSVVTAMYNDKEEAYVIIVCDRVGAGEFATYVASTASGYPSIE